MRGLRNIADLLVIVAAAVALNAMPVAAGAQTPAPSQAAVANPELVGALAKELGSTPQQAEGAAGALFGLAKSRLAADEWTKVSGAVPGMDGLLKAAPVVSAPAGSAATKALAGAGGLASMANAFTKLGLKPELVSKAIPVLTSFVTKSGGAGVGSLLAGVLK